MKWFQDLPGNVPIDEPQVALDYGMNEAFKSLPAWFKATGQSGQLNFVQEFNEYSGHPAPEQK
ncbi:MAG: hypothetical protein R3A44_43465 [Caldilineaceae bacterium]